MKYRLLALLIALFLYTFVHYNAARASGIQPAAKPSQAEYQIEHIQVPAESIP